MELLGKIKQPWSRQFYNAIAPHVALTAIETVFLRAGPSGGLKSEVLLHKRPETDIPEWRGRSASPGSMLRATDHSYEDAVRRVKRELGGARLRYRAEPVASIFNMTERGPENGIVLACELVDEPPPSFWWHSVYTLPYDLLRHHYGFLEAILVWYNLEFNDRNLNESL